MSVSFHGIGAVVATFQVEDGAELKVGEAVTLTKDSIVGHGKENDLPCGVVVSVRQNYAGVQMGGLVEVCYTGDAPKVGWRSMSVNGAGKVKFAESGGLSVLVLSVDTNSTTALIKL